MKTTTRHLLGLIVGAASAAAQSFQPGSIQGQNGWNGGVIPISPSVDQSVVTGVSATADGSGSFRISNNTSAGNYNGNFGGWVFGPSLGVAAGQPSSGAVANQFSVTFSFRSAATIADGSNIEVDFGNSARTDRTNFVALTNFADGAGGLSLRTSDADGNTAVTIPNITRGAWHTVTVTGSFINGAANDTFNILLDGVQVATGIPTFEPFFAANGGTYPLTDNFFMRSGRTPSDSGVFTNTDAAGFYIDDLGYFASNGGNTLASYTTNFAVVPETSTVVTGIAVSGLVGFWMIRRRRVQAVA